MKKRMRHPRERLTIDQWPSALAQAWRQATSVAPLFDDQGSAAHWSTVTQRGVERGLGLYLGFLGTMGALRAEDTPTSISARPLLSAYYEHCRQRSLSAASMATRYNVLNEA
jgi:hypothetical protein